MEKMYQNDRRDLGRQSRMLGQQSRMLGQFFGEGMAWIITINDYYFAISVILCI